MLLGRYFPSYQRRQHFCPGVPNNLHGPVSPARRSGAEAREAEARPARSCRLGGRRSCQSWPLRPSSAEQRVIASASLTTRARASGNPSRVSCCATWRASSGFESWPKP